MKKFFLLISFMCLLSAAAFAKANDDQEFILKAGFQPQGTASFDGKNFDTNVGISAGLEYFKYVGNIFAYGGGAVYDLPRKFKDSDENSGSISFLPVYAGVKIRTPLEGLNNNYAFLTGRLGYGAFMYNDIDEIKSSSGGLYCSVGVGISISVMVFEAIYAVNKYSYDIQSAGVRKSFDENYSTISIYAGFKFE
jgi:hypothetical protein